MKNIYRLGFLLLFLGIGFYMIETCYARSVIWGSCINVMELMQPTKNNVYMDPFFALCIFTPAIILILSFFWKTPFSKLQRAFLLVLTISAAWMGIFNVFMGVCSLCNLTTHHLVISGWNFASFLWILLLTIIPEWAGVNWPFDKKEK